MTFYNEYEMYNNLEEAESTIDALNVYINYLKGRVEKLEEENDLLKEKIYLCKEFSGTNSGYNEDDESSDSYDSSDSSDSADNFEIDIDVEEVDLN